MVTIPPPRWTGKAPEDIHLKGKLIPWHQGEVVQVIVAGAGPAVPVFSDIVKLREAMTVFDVESDGAKVIMDTWEFLESIPPSVLVILDPWMTTEGKVRYIMVLR